MWQEFETKDGHFIQYRMVGTGNVERAGDGATFEIRAFDSSDREIVATYDHITAVFDHANRGERE